MEETQPDRNPSKTAVPLYVTYVQAVECSKVQMDEQILWLEITFPCPDQSSSPCLSDHSSFRPLLSLRCPVCRYPAFFPAPSV